MQLRWDICFEIIFIVFFFFFILAIEFIGKIIKFLSKTLHEEEKNIGDFRKEN